MRIERNKPALLFALPRLINRLPDHFSGKQELKKQLYKIEAGYAGELKVDQYLQAIPYLASKIILTNIQLPIKFGTSFQIDTLIIAKQYIFILEVKNIKGHLYFKENPHYLLRTLDGIDTTMECPITQLELAKVHLTTWLEQHGIKTDVHGEIILVNKSSVIKEIPSNSPVTFLKRLSLSLLKKESLPIKFNNQQLERIVRLILQQKIDSQYPPLCDYFKIDPSFLKTGQLCVKCYSSTIYKTERIRRCTYCRTEQPNNFQEPIKDWFLLVNPSITNAQCRSFLGL